MSRVICGDSAEVLKTLPAGIVQTCVTSPPYYGLRDYGVEGQIGLEPTPEEFIARLVAVFREVKRVLRDDGTLWVNIGDSYAGSGRGEGGKTSKQITNAGSLFDVGELKGNVPNGCKPKDLLGIPWMLAFALRSDGWYLRNEIIWAKPNPMPESVTDRCTKSHEQIFLLSKQAQYFYDAEAVKEESTESTLERGAYGWNGRVEIDGDGKERRAQPDPTDKMGERWCKPTRNKRDVWTVSTKPYSGAHFATFPRDLIVPCILAGSRPGDVVLDPFGGAGTTAKTAQELGREYITIELSQKYVDEIILPRLASTSVPLPLPISIQSAPVETQGGLL